MIKAIADHYGYFISDDGKVYCILGRGNRNKSNVSNIYEIKPRYTRQGYARICARNNVTGKRDDLYIHRLVAEYFLDKDPNKKYVNHKNCIRSDNRVENLEWCTAKENTNQTAKLGHIIRDENGRYKSNFNYNAIVMGG